MCHSLHVVMGTTYVFLIYFGVLLDMFLTNSYYILLKRNEFIALQKIFIRCVIISNLSCIFFLWTYLFPFVVVF